MSPTRTFAAVLGVVAVVCAVLAFKGGDDARAGSSTHARVTTPVWSARRVPQPIVDAVGAQRLQAALDSTVAGNDACFVVNEGGAPLASHSPEVPLVPASTQKLLTTAAALTTLGPTATLDTRAMAEHAPDSGSVDRLYLVGGGDPLLGTADFQAALDSAAETQGTKITDLGGLADSIVKAGVKRIPGGIVADDSRYETLRYLPSWKDTYRTDGEVGPLGALTVDRGFSAFKPKPLPVDDPATFAAQQLATMLAARGVDVGKAATRGQAPASSVEVAKISTPLNDVVSEILRNSDNLGAELLARELAFRAATQPGTTAAGIQAVAAKLKGLGLDTTGLTLVDGSGLDRGDRATCQLLVGALGLGAQPSDAVLWSGLPVLGQSGTLIGQLGGTPLAGKVRAKTGSLDGVTGLVGIVDVGRPLRFAFLANGGFTEKGGFDLRARVAQVIASFPDSPKADELVPQPDAKSPSAQQGTAP